MMRWFKRIFSKTPQSNKRIVFTDRIICANIKPSEVYVEDLGQYLIHWSRIGECNLGMVEKSNKVEFIYKGELIGYGGISGIADIRGHVYYILSNVVDNSHKIKQLEGEQDSK